MSPNPKQPPRKIGQTAQMKYEEREREREKDLLG
jgi:hypothetical protein